jgi:Uma2 family endonuclease
METARKRLAVAEFFEHCPDDRRHYQLIDGVIVAMAPPGSRRQVIAGNLAGHLFNALQANLPDCSLRAKAGIVPVGPHGRDHFEADLAVTCAPPAEGDQGIVRDPLLIVEILSPSNDRDDVFVKLPWYKRIAGLREILYLETERVAATVQRRGGDGKWLPEERVAGADGRLRLATVGLDLPLALLYRGAEPK